MTFLLTCTGTPLKEMFRRPKRFIRIGVDLVRSGSSIAPVRRLA